MTAARVLSLKPAMNCVAIVSESPYLRASERILRKPLEELHFVDDDMEGRAGLGRRLSARHARGLDAGKQERTHQVRRRLADDAAREVGDDDSVALFRHGVLEMQGALRLTDDIENRGREEKGVDLVQDGRDRFLAITIAPAIKLAFEKIRVRGLLMREVMRARNAVSVRSRGSNTRDAFGVSGAPRTNVEGSARAAGPTYPSRSRACPNHPVGYDRAMVGCTSSRTLKPNGWRYR